MSTNEFNDINLRESTSELFSDKNISKTNPKSDNQLEDLSNCISDDLQISKIQKEGSTAIYAYYVL